MNKYLGMGIFYASAFTAIYALNILSPGPPDGGLGLAGFALIILEFCALGLALHAVIRGFKSSKDYFILAGIHLLVFFGLLFYLFL
jgi:hypothetical protein